MRRAVADQARTKTETVSTTVRLVPQKNNTFGKPRKQSSATVLKLERKQA